LRHDGWAELVNDEEHGGCLIPMMMLYHEQLLALRQKVNGWLKGQGTPTAA
jgi:hypothetical protein